MSEKQRVTLNLDSGLVAWMDEEYGNRSKFVNDLLQRAKEGDSQMDRVVAQYQLEQLKGQKATVESRLESIEGQINKFKKKAQRFEEEQENVVEDAYDSLNTTRLEPDNPAVENWADKAEMTPEELIEELEEMDDAE